jgi:hypothetical protein
MPRNVGLNSRRMRNTVMPFLTRYQLDSTHLANLKKIRVLLVVESLDPTTAPIKKLDPVLLGKIIEYLGGRRSSSMRNRKPHNKRHKTKSRKQRRN